MEFLLSLWGYVPLAVWVAFYDAFCFFDFWGYAHDLFVHGGHEAFYAAAVHFFFTAEVSEEVVPDSKGDFSFVWVEFRDFYFSLDRRL